MRQGYGRAGGHNGPEESRAKVSWASGVGPGRDDHSGWAGENRIDQFADGNPFWLPAGRTARPVNRVAGARAIQNSTPGPSRTLCQRSESVADGCGPGVTRTAQRWNRVFNRNQPEP